MASGLSDKWTFFDVLLQRMRYRQIVRFVPEGAVLADLGCGDGRFLGHVCGKITLGYGIDQNIPSPPTYPNVFFRESDLNGPIPLDNASVDAVVALAVLEHLVNPQGFVRQIHRILRPGGIALLTTPAPRARALLEFLAYRAKIISEGDIRDHKQYLSRKDLSGLFRPFSSVSITHFQLGFNTFITARK